MELSQTQKSIMIYFLGAYKSKANINAERSQCERVAYETTRADRGAIILKTVNRLIGTWVSEG